MKESYAEPRCNKTDICAYSTSGEKGTKANILPRERREQRLASLARLIMAHFLRQLAYVMLDRAHGSQRARRGMSRLKPGYVETIDLPCPSAPKTQLISRPHSVSVVPRHLLASTPDKLTRYLNSNALTTLPSGVFDGLGSLTTL